jgi:acetate---CoA ligase (ADP-forming)
LAGVLLRRTLRALSARMPRADIDALATAVVNVSEMAAALPPSVASIEINPLLVLPAGEGVLMLDVAIELEEGLPG